MCALVAKRALQIETHARNRPRGREGKTASIRSNSVRCCRRCAFRWIVNTDSGDHERRPERHGGPLLLTVFNHG